MLANASIKLLLACLLASETDVPAALIRADRKENATHTHYVKVGIPTGGRVTMVTIGYYGYYG
jgi:hypothetical protein